MIIDKQTWLDKKEYGLFTPDFAGLEYVKGYLPYYGTISLSDSLHFVPAAKAFETLEAVSEFLKTEGSEGDLYVHSLTDTVVQDLFQLSPSDRQTLNQLRASQRELKAKKAFKERNPETSEFSSEQSEEEIDQQINNILSKVPSKPAYRLIFLTYRHPES